MQLGKRRQPTRSTSTAIGPIAPAQGLAPRHADEALRIATRADSDTKASSGLRSIPVVRRAAQLLIGCAHRAGMGSIRAVSQASRILLRRAAETDASVETVATTTARAAAAAWDEIGLAPREAASAAGLAALQAARDMEGTEVLEVGPAVRRVVEDLATDAPSTPREAPTLETLKREAAAAAESAARAMNVESRDARARDAAEIMRAAEKRQLAPADAIRKTARGIVASGLSAGRDIATLARSVVRGAVTAAPSLGLPRRRAAALAAAYVVDAATIRGDHAARAGWSSIVSWPVAS